MGSATIRMATGYDSLLWPCLATTAGLTRLHLRAIDVLKPQILKSFVTQHEPLALQLRPEVCWSRWVCHHSEQSRRKRRDSGCDRPIQYIEAATRLNHFQASKDCASKRCRVVCEECSLLLHSVFIAHRSSGKTSISTSCEASSSSCSPCTASIMRWTRSGGRIREAKPSNLLCSSLSVRG